MPITFTQKLIYTCIYFCDLKKLFFASTYSCKWQVFENFASTYFCKWQGFENFEFKNFCESTENEKKSWMSRKKTYLRLESFTELHFQVLQPMKHIKRFIVHIIFVTNVVWYVTCRFPFRMIIVAMIFIIASEVMKFFWKEQR